MNINMDYYKNNPITEIHLGFKNLIGTELEKELFTFRLDQRSLHCVGYETFYQWKFNMSGEELEETYDITYSSYPNNKHFSAQYYIDEQGNWFEKGETNV